MSIRKLLLLFLAVPCLANGPKYVGPNRSTTTLDKSNIYSEFVNVYHDIQNPIINSETVSTGTLKFVSISTATCSSCTITNLTIVNPISVPSGGTGLGTLTQNGVLYGNGANAIGITAQGGSNSVLTANAGTPSFSTTPILTSVTFGAGTALSTYQEGTWTPSDKSGAGLSFTTHVAKYTKIGSIVFIECWIDFPATGNGAGVQIGTLPFSVDDESMGPLSTNSAQTAVVRFSPGTTNFQLLQLAGRAQLINSNLSSNQVIFEGFYFHN